MSFLFATIRLLYSLHMPTQKWAKASEETRTLWHPKDIFVMAPIVETRKIGKEWARGAEIPTLTLWGLKVLKEKQQASQINPLLI